MSPPLLAVLLACLAPGPSTPAPGPGETGQAPDLDDTGAPPDTAVSFSAVEVEILSLGTSARLRWATSPPSLGAARLADGTVSAWEDEASDTHSVVIVGLPADSTVTVELLAAVGEQLHASEPIRFTTGALSTDLPDFQLDSPGDPAPGYRLFGLFDAVGADRPARVLALDAEGRVVWEHVMGPGTMVGGIEPDLERGRLLISSGTQIQALHLVDGSAQLLPGADYHHDLALGPDGAIAAPAARAVEHNGGTYIFDDIVELSADGGRRVVKDGVALFTELGLSLSDLSGAAGSMGLDVLHVNAIEYDAVHDRYVVGAPGVGTLVGVQRQTGELDFALGHLTPSRLAAQPLLTHQVDLDGDRLLWFVNQAEGDPCARVWTLTLDDAGFGEEQRWPLDRCASILGLGGVVALPGGHRLVTWAHQGIVEEVDDAGDVVQRLTFGEGLTVGYAAWVPSLQPTRLNP